MHYCDHCNHHIHGVIKTDLVATRNIRNTPIEVTYEGRVCEHCGHVLYEDEVEAAITREAVAIYRRQAHLLNPEAVEQLIKQFGADMLAQMVSCSVSEIVNSVHGGVHSAKTDAELRNIMENLKAEAA